MKRLIALSAVAAIATASFGSQDVESRLSAMESKVKKLEKELKKAKKTATDAKILANADNIKWDVNLRTAVDKINYTSAEGKKYSNDALLTNRLWLGMGYAPSENIIFKGKLAYHKVFGAAPVGDNTNGTNTNGMPQRGYGYDAFDWVNAETANSDKVTVKEAYWLYMNDTFLGTDVSWTASVGRRPSTDGFLSNMRNDTPAQSPLGHIIDVEFDGASFKFGLDKVTGVDGMYWKLCLGRGMSNATPRFDMSGGLDSKGDYSEDKNALDTIDLAGFIFVPYNDGQYSVETTMFKANNLPGFEAANGTLALSGTDFTLDGDGMVSKMKDSGTLMTGGTFGGMQATEFNAAKVEMKTMGDLSGAAISFKADGLGDDISDFLNDTTFFASWAQSKTSPDNNRDVMDTSAFDNFIGGDGAAVATGIAGMETMYNMDIDADGTIGAVTDMATGMVNAGNMSKRKSGMLGSTKSETGSSIYMGVNMPCPLTEDGRIGVEWNKGSKYWRSFTYAEDTMAGSKLATRGTAWEVYYTKPLLKELTFQVRYTNITYDYTGSQAFFGDDGTPMTMAEAKGFGMDPIEKATDLRASITYRF